MSFTAWPFYYLRNCTCRVVDGHNLARGGGNISCFLTCYKDNVPADDLQREILKSDPQDLNLSQLVRALALLCKLACILCASTLELMHLAL